jgi:hypothetical protein
MVATFMGFVEVWEVQRRRWAGSGEDGGAVAAQEHPLLGVPAHGGSHGRSFGSSELFIQLIYKRR